MKRVNNHSDSGIGAPLLTPNDLHSTLDPLTKIILTQRTANDNLACTNSSPDCMAFPTERTTYQPICAERIQPQCQTCHLLKIIIIITKESQAYNYIALNL